MAKVKSSIDAVKNIATALDTTVGYLLGESKKHEVLKDTAMLKRLNDIASFPDEDKKHIHGGAGLYLSVTFSFSS